MKKVALFFVGAVVGFILCFAILYLSGMAIEYFGIRLYASEADQQRNLNAFLIVSGIVSFLSGFFLAKKQA